MSDPKTLKPRKTARRASQQPRAEGKIENTKAEADHVHAVAVNQNLQEDRNPQGDEGYSFADLGSTAASQPHVDPDTTSIDQGSFSSSGGNEDPWSQYTMRHTGADQHPEYETMEATSRDGNGDGEEYISGIRRWIRKKKRWLKTSLLLSASNKRKGSGGGKKTDE